MGINVCCVIDFHSSCELFFLFFNRVCMFRFGIQEFEHHLYAIVVDMVSIWPNVLNASHIFIINDVFDANIAAHLSGICKFIIEKIFPAELFST